MLFWEGLSYRKRSRCRELSPCQWPSSWCVERAAIFCQKSHRQDANDQKTGNSLSESHLTSWYSVQRLQSVRKRGTVAIQFILYLVASNYRQAWVPGVKMSLKWSDGRTCKCVRAVFSLCPYFYISSSVAMDMKHSWKGMQKRSLSLLLLFRMNKKIGVVHRYCTLFGPYSRFLTMHGCSVNHSITEEVSLSTKMKGESMAKGTTGARRCNVRKVGVRVHACQCRGYVPLP